MINYAEIKRFEETSFGQVRFIGQTETLPLGDKRILFVDLAGYDPQPQVGWYFDKGNDVFSEAPPIEAVVPKAKLTAAEFWMETLTFGERARVWGVCNGEAVPGVTITLEQRYRLAAFRDLSLAGELIPLHANETITMVNGMELAGIIDPGRAAEILG